MKSPFLVLTCLVAAVSIACNTRAFSEEKTEVLVVTGGHGFEEKPFYEMFASYTNLSCTYLDVKDGSEIFEDISNWPYKVIVLYNMSPAISEKSRQNLLALLEKGIGLVALHHAIGAFPDWHEYRKIIGAKYWLKDAVESGVQHPKSLWEEGVDMKLHVEDPTHPVMAGIPDFIVHDETYKGYDLEPDNHVILSCSEPGSQKEVAWTRTYSAAKVCFIQPGHGANAFADKNYRQMVLQAIQWVHKQ